MSEETLRRRAENDPGQHVLPFYLMCDVSWSMHNDMSALNDALRQLVKSVADDPICNDVAQLALMKFSDDAETFISLDRPKAALRELEQRSGLDYENSTNYSNAFRAIRAAIQADADRLKGSRYSVYRPVVFFLTDGEPNPDDPWADTFRDTLTYNPKTGQGFKQHPILIPIGFRDAEPDTLKKLAFPPDKARWYFARTLDVKTVLETLHAIILKTIVASSNSHRARAGGQTGQGQPVHQFDDASGLSEVDTGHGDYDPEML